MQQGSHGITPFLRGLDDDAFNEFWDYFSHFPRKRREDFVRFGIWPTLPEEECKAALNFIPARSDALSPSEAGADQEHEGEALINRPPSPMLVPTRPAAGQPEKGPTPDGEDDVDSEEVPLNNKSKKKRSKDATDHVVVAQKRSKARSPQPEVSLYQEEDQQPDPDHDDDEEDGDRNLASALKRDRQEVSEDSGSQVQDGNAADADQAPEKRPRATPTLAQSDASGGVDDPPSDQAQTPAQTGTMRLQLSERRRSTRLKHRTFSTPEASPDKSQAEPSPVSESEMVARLEEGLKASKLELTWEVVKGPYFDELNLDTSSGNLDEQKTALMQRLLSKYPDQAQALVEFVSDDVPRVALGKLQRTEVLLEFTCAELRNRAGNQRGQKLELALTLAKRFSLAAEDFPSERSVHVTFHTKLCPSDREISEFKQDPKPFLAASWQVERESEAAARIAKCAFDTHLAAAWRTFGKTNPDVLDVLTSMFEELPKSNSYWLGRKRRGDLLLKYPALAYQSVLALDSLPDSWTLRDIKRVMDTSQTLRQAHDELVKTYPQILKLPDDFCPAL